MHILGKGESHLFFSKYILKNKKSSFIEMYESRDCLKREVTSKVQILSWIYLRHSYNVYLTGNDKKDKHAVNIDRI